MHTLFHRTNKIALCKLDWQVFFSLIICYSHAAECKQSN